VISSVQKAARRKSGKTEINELTKAASQDESRLGHLGEMMARQPRRSVIMMIALLAWDIR
jgi:hypothetical protein